MSSTEFETKQIRVGEISDGPLTAGAPGTSVSLPVVDLLTGRGFITGKSGSGKSNSASVVIERLLNGGYGCLIVDTDGEYYGLKEQFELLHVGADDEFDLQVSAEHAERLADLALDRNVPIILDVSGFLDEDDASELVREVAKHLFAKEKKQKQPFLMLIEECHEYIPEGGGMDETGKMLIKVAKRGRKHGLGIVGISQRPADVKKDFITQCDWLCWHRLTWNNDTKVVGRLLGSEYAGAGLSDTEAAVVADLKDERDEYAARVDDLESELSEVRDELATVREERDDLRDEVAAFESWQEDRETVVATLQDLADHLDADIDAPVSKHNQGAKEADENQTEQTDGAGRSLTPVEFLECDTVSRAVEHAAENAKMSRDGLMGLLAELARSDEPMSYADLSKRRGVAEGTLRGYFGPLQDAGLVEDVGEGRTREWTLATDNLARIQERLDRDARLDQLTST